MIPSRTLELEVLAPKGPRLAPWLDRIYICLNVHLIHAGEIKIDKASISLFCVNKNCMCVCAHILIIMILIYIKLIYDVNIDIIIYVFMYIVRDFFLTYLRHVDFPQIVCLYSDFTNFNMELLQVGHRQQGSHEPIIGLPYLSGQGHCAAVRIDLESDWRERLCQWTVF